MRAGCDCVFGFLSDFDILTQSCSTKTNRSTLQDGRWELTLGVRGNTAMYTPEAPACAARPSPWLSPGPRPSAPGLGIIMCMCVFFVQNLHAERPRPGKGWPRPYTIQEKN